MSKYFLRVMTIALLAAGIVGMTGCATNLRKPKGEPQPAKVKLGTFKSVGLKPVVLAPKFASASANEKARVKINELLVQDMKARFADLVLLTEEDEETSKKKPALIIEPVIEEIKFIGGAARFWVGPMAGSSAVLMQVKFIDSATGDLLADPEFYQSANAWGGGMTMGGNDNMMLDRIVMEISKYTNRNM